MSYTENRRKGYRSLGEFGNGSLKRNDLRREKSIFSSDVEQLHKIIRENSDLADVYQHRQVSFLGDDPRLNDAETAQYLNPYSLNVVSRSQPFISDVRGITREKSFCDRKDVETISANKRQYCDVLGMEYCSDCSRIGEQSLKKFQKEPTLYFVPKIDKSSALFGGSRRRITFPKVKTPMDVFNRVYGHHQYLRSITDPGGDRIIQTTNLPNLRPKSIYW
ncbi:hypothetical protein SNE40_020078 [Patella caerulea]|uniref:Uncharacterized protein n=1 Tax=Patella caerulea TaxID=87958 RepID=A0AAN8G6N7_PATCE